MNSSHEEHSDKILEVISSGAQVSQRSLSRDLDIALGLTNLLLRRLVVRGLVRVSRVKPRRVRYLLTPQGLAEKARMSRRIMARALERYRNARDRLQVTLMQASGDWPSGQIEKPVVFYGTGELAEIAFVCVEETDLHLVAAFDDTGRSRFFGVRLMPVSKFQIRILEQFGDPRVVVVSMRDREELARELGASGVAPGRVFWT